MKAILVLIVIIILAAAGVYFFFPNLIPEDFRPEAQPAAVGTSSTDGAEDGMATTTNQKETAIGTSVGGRAITAYHYGSGEKEVLFVGGIHGGYSYNTALVAYELMEYLEANPALVPEGVRVTVVPVLNPDGLFELVGTEGKFSAADITASDAELASARFNGNDVDLNRNFDCDWKQDATWQSKSVFGGSAAFSEPESQAIRNYVETHTPSAVVVWYSAVGGVFASNCHEGVLAETRELTNVYADASGYRAYEAFNFYEITGDMVNWLAKEGVPAISVLLTNHTDTEWSKNQKGVDALLAHVAPAPSDSAEDVETPVE